MAGHATLLQTTLNADGSCTVTDDGRGIPTDVHPTTGVSALETVLTVLHAGGKFDNESGGSGYKVSGGLHGVGISVVNALSEWVKVQVHRKKQEFFMEFQRGTPVGPLEVTGETVPVVHAHVISEDEGSKEVKGKKKSVDTIEEGMTFVEKVDLVKKLQSKRKSGTSVTFLPDITVFKGDNGKPGIKLDPARLRGRMDELAYLNPGLVLTLQDKRMDFRTIHIISHPCMWCLIYIII